MQVQTISSTAQKFNGTTYYLCGNYYQRKGKRLHREVWEYHNGEIPKGYDIHHINGDRSDNDITNLQLLTRSEHQRAHQTPERRQEERERMPAISEYAKAWHKTERGKQFHSEHAKEYWANAGMNTYTCTYCGKEFQTKHVYGQYDNTFCCAKHKAYWRKEQGIDNETKTCPICGKEFEANRYAKKVCCSKSCATKKRWGK